MGFNLGFKGLTDFFSSALVPVVALIEVQMLCSKLRFFFSTYLVNYEILFLCHVSYRFYIR